MSQPDPLAVLTAPAVPVDRLRRRAIPIPAGLIATSRRQLGLVSREQCRLAGLPRGRLFRLLERGDWREVTRGVLLVQAEAVEVDDWPARARQRALVAALAGGPGTVLLGAAALAMHGIEGPALEYVPEFAKLAGGQARARPECRQRRLTRRPDVVGHPKTLTIDDVLVAGPLWAVAQTLPSLERRRAIAVVDSALYRRKLLRRDLPTLMAALAGVRNVLALRESLGLCDG
ncbi:type IV toxin-antitoxin system AbiEi family antitoxin domain-containing protein [Litorihabitans aurantiacus]|uniref:AbiEi antitoxin N-terminal domain-containing protein n=1 Tax=Litorihabitans aurantiacus TaxID=1930061 RepID=A0AA37UUB3_9MICO|nr:type IV toxin-antitoxin system AbiEi family antitoxin domain-containing protein [Litorihabitans aurantiacus]GMA30366.1 hypothetical protein GCM10025875_03580 [Litorihabitans aurantiacus]